MTTRFRGSRLRERWRFRLHPATKHVDRHIPIEWVTKRSVVSYQNRYVCFRIPNAANSAVVNTLVRHDASLGAIASNLSRKRISRSSRGLFKTSAWSPESLARKYFCFTVVRNPFARAVSAYLDKIVGSVGRYEEVTNALGKASISDISFPDFVQFLENGGLFANAHWTPQSSLLPIAPALLSFIGRVETLEHDLERLVPWLMPAAPYGGLHSRQDIRRNSNAKLHGYYDDALLRQVYRISEKDFQIFGYHNELPELEGA